MKRKEKEAILVFFDGLVDGTFSPANFEPWMLESVGTMKDEYWLHLWSMAEMADVARGVKLPAKVREAIKGRHGANVVFPTGHWEELGEAAEPHFWWHISDEELTRPVTIFGVPMHLLAIATTGEDEQMALDQGSEWRLEALHAAGGSDAGYMETTIRGRPFVIFLVPFDRET